MIENPDLDPNNLTQPSNAFHPLYENQLEAITHEAQAAAEVVDDEQDANSTASIKVIFVLSENVTNVHNFKTFCHSQRKIPGTLECQCVPMKHGMATLPRLQPLLNY